MPQIESQSCDLWLRDWLSCGAAELFAALLLWHNPRLPAHFELCSSGRCVALTKELGVAQNRRVQLTAQVTLYGLRCSALCNISCRIPFLVKTCKYILSDGSLWLLYSKTFAMSFMQRSFTVPNYLQCCFVTLTRLFDPDQVWFHQNTLIMALIELRLVYVQSVDVDFFTFEVFWTIEAPHSINRTVAVVFLSSFFQFFNNISKIWTERSCHLQV